MMNGNWDIAQHLIQAGADVNQWDIYGQAPLHVAIETAYVTAGSSGPTWARTARPTKSTASRIVKTLVEQGADPNQQMFFRAPRERGQVSVRCPRHDALPPRRGLR